VQSNDPASSLAQFLRDYITWCRTEKSKMEFIVMRPADSFIWRMASARNLYVRWNSGLATKNRTKQQIAIELERSLEFIGGCRSMTLGWALLSELQKGVTDEDQQRQIADAAEQFEKIPGLQFLVRHERARSLFNGGEPAKARKLYLESIQVGLLPPIDAAIRTAFRADDAADWDSLLQKAHGELIAKKRLRTALLFALQCRQAVDAKVGELLFDDVVARVSVTERPDVTLLAAEYLRQRKLYNRADALLTPVLQDERFKASTQLWRFAAELANQRGKKASALSRQERALDLEFAQLPDLVNLESIRRDYSDLMNRYEQVVDASATLETEPPSDLLPRVIRIADRWRSLDTDDTAACQAAARIIAKLGRKELAWDYLTTPLAMKPNEAAPWLGMAQALAQQNDVELADRSYRSAFAAEPTNAQILWDHAELLRKHGRTQESRVILRQMTEGKWQPRFNAVLQRARQTLGTNR
jgi:Tfp pilus assembly protein PilF